MKPGAKHESHLPYSEISVRIELARMLAHEEFTSSARMSRFLQFVVESTFEGNTSTLKETSIGVAVFDRDPDYDPKVDPVVRSEARRLRLKIARFYELAGEGGTVQISLPKGGYTPIFVSPSAPAAPSTELLPQAPPPKQLSRHWVVVIALISITTVLSGIVLFRTRKADAPWRNVRLSSMPGREFSPTLSPDGLQTAFVWDSGDGQFDIYVVNNSDGTSPRRLISHPARDFRPSWSPDGKRLAYLRANVEKVEVRLFDFATGNDAKLTEINSFEWFSLQSDPLHGVLDPGPAWMPDSKAILLSDQAGSLRGAAIWRVELDSGLRTQVTAPTLLSSDCYPAVSPDGSKLAFTRKSSAATADIYVVPLQAGTPRRLTHDNSDIRGLAWLGNGSLLFSSNRRGGHRLWEMEIATTKLNLFPAEGERILSLSVTPDAKRVVYTSSRFNVNLWRIPIGAKGLHNEMAEKWSASSGENNFPRFSPDGKRVAWASDRSGSWQVWTSSVDGQNAEPLSQMGEEFNGRLAGTPRWSPDGKWIAFDARPGAKCALYVIAATGGPIRRIDEGFFEQRNPSWSHDGKHVYFNSDRGGKVQIWKSPVGGGPAISVSEHRAYDAIESPDGKEVYFVQSNEDAGLWRIRLQDKSENLVPGTTPYLIRRHWDANSKGIYFVGHGKSSARLFLLHWGSDKMEDLGEWRMNLIAGVNSLAISPDGKTALAAQLDEATADLMQIYERP